MNDAHEVFGHMPSGEPVYRIRIEGGGLTAHVITRGAAIQDLRLANHAPPLMLGFEDLASYMAYSPYFGATPGRNSNRIGGGRFEIDGVAFQLELNEKGVTHLHGGSDGIAKRNWSILSLSAGSVTMQIVDPDGRAGYPGDCTISATYTLHGDGCLSVVYESTADKPTPCNICQHSYFNLDGEADALDHEIMIAADHYLPTDEKQVPTGEIRSVAGTAFDLRKISPMRRQMEGEKISYDHNFCLSTARMDKRSVAIARSPRSGVSMEVLTTEPGVQFYSGFKLNIPVPGLDGRTYGAYAGFCLETQIWPDAINQPHFPAAVLRPGEVLRQETDYIFRKD